MWSTFVPSGFRNWRERRLALRELKAMEAADQGKLALDDTNPVYRAKTALQLGDRNEALRCWLDACQRMPQFVQTSHDSLDILLGLRRHEEAEALMLAGRKRFPRDSYYAAGYAEIATYRNDHAEAANRWAAARKAFPGAWRAYAFGAAALNRIGRHDEAEAVLEAAITIFPENLLCRIEHARMAEIRKDWPTAQSRWGIVSKEFNHVAGGLGTAQALREMGRLDDAEAYLAELRLRFPIAIDIVMQQARLAQLRGDEAVELRAWESVLKSFPLEQRGYYEAAHRLGEMGRVAEADDVLRRAVGRFPQDVRPSVEYAAFAHERGDWPEANARWQAVRAAWPDCEDGYIRGADALRKLGRHEEAIRLGAEHSRPDLSAGSG